MVSSADKPRLGFAQLWNMNLGFLGIQFGFALQNANMSRIFQNLGADVGKLSFLWLAAPVTGLLVQPVIGYWSDRTWHPFWGRRRPFFFFGAILATIALFLMPHATLLLVAALLLWLLDASINISMEPFRAFVADKLPSGQRTTGFAFQTFFIGIGAVAGSEFPFLLHRIFHISHTALPGSIPLNVQYSFYIGGLIFVSTVAWTVFSSREYPAVDLSAWQNERNRTKGLSRGLRSMSRAMVSLPPVMVQLAAVQFFTWIAFFSLWIYTTSGIADTVFHTTDPASAAFQGAGDWVGVLFALYNGVSAVAAFLLPLLARKIRRTNTHLLCLVLGGLGLISLFFIRDKYLLFLPMVPLGLAWASTLTMPYAILAGGLPAEKMGFYMGVFNFFIVIPQIIAAGLLGFLVRDLFHDRGIFALVLGGVSMILGGLLNLRVRDQEDPEGLPDREWIPAPNATPNLTNRQTPGR